MNIPRHLDSPVQTKHRKIYETVNKILDYLDEQYEPKEERETPIGGSQCNDCYDGDHIQCSGGACECSCRTPKERARLGGASPSNKATKIDIEESGYDFLKKQKDRMLSDKRFHWESDYAAIWERYRDDGRYIGDVQKDILELIRKLV
jgi:hypothetical protein